MTHVLTTFLGRVQRHESGYPTLEYRFPDDSTRRAAFVGFPLARWLGADRLLVLGTAGSMWDHLFEADVRIPDLEDERLALVEAVDEHAVEQAQLNGLAPRLGEELGCGIDLRLIPPALAEEEQISLLSTLAELTEEADQLSIDVTHGYRHLPMLALTAALYLRSLRPRLILKGLWYAAVDAESQKATLSNLRGLLEISDWIGAWQRFEALGDYGAISPLIRAQDPQLAELLQDAAFHESVHQGQQARGLLQKVRARLQERPLSGAGALFQPALLERTEWVKHQRLYLRQRQHAFAALERPDHLRACLYGFEAFITKLAQQQGGDPNTFEARQAAKEAFEVQKPTGQWHAYAQLRDLRNVLAHGNRVVLGSTQRALHSPDRLHAVLADNLSTLLSETPA